MARCYVKGALLINFTEAGNGRATEGKRVGLIQVKEVEGNIDVLLLVEYVINSRRKVMVVGDVIGSGRGCTAGIGNRHEVQVKQGDWAKT